MIMKRKFNVLSLETKLKLLADVDKKTGPIKDIAKRYGIPPNSVSTIIKNRQQVENALAECSFQPNRKRLRLSRTAKVDKALIQWVKNANAEGALISGPILRDRAEFIAKTIDVATEFKANSGWLERFKRRYGLVYQNNGTNGGYHIVDGRTTPGSVFKIEEDIHDVTCKRLKRKSNTVLNLETKLKLLDDVDKKTGPIKDIAKKYGIPPNSVSTIIKNRQQVENALAECSFQPNRKRLRLSRTAKVDKALIQWVKNANAKGALISGSVLRDQAEFLAKTIDAATEFKATYGWLERFKRRHGLIHRHNGTKGGCYYITDARTTPGPDNKFEEDIFTNEEERGKAACLKDRDSPSWVPTLHLVPHARITIQDINATKSEDDPTSSVSGGSSSNFAEDSYQSNSEEMANEVDMSVKIKEEPMDPEFVENEIDPDWKSDLSVKFEDGSKGLLNNGSDNVGEIYPGRGKKRDFYGNFSEEVNNALELKYLKRQEAENQEPTSNSTRNGGWATEEHKRKSNRDESFHISTSHGFTKSELNQALVELENLSKKQLELLVCVMGREICRLQDSVQYLSTVVKNSNRDYRRIFSELEEAEGNWEDECLNEKLAYVGMSLVEDVASGTLELVHLPTKRIIFQRQQLFKNSGAKPSEKSTACSLEIESATETEDSIPTSNTVNSRIDTEPSASPYVQISRRKKSVPLRCVTSPGEASNSKAVPKDSNSTKTKMSSKPSLPPSKVQESTHVSSTSPPTEVQESTAATKDVNKNPTESLERTSVKKEDSSIEHHQTSHKATVKERFNLHSTKDVDNQSSNSENNLLCRGEESVRKRVEEESSFNQAESVSIKQEIMSDDDEGPPVEPVMK